MTEHKEWTDAQSSEDDWTIQKLNQPDKSVKTLVIGFTFTERMQMIGRYIALMWKTFFVQANQKELFALSQESGRMFSYYMVAMGPSKELVRAEVDKRPMEPFGVPGYVNTFEKKPLELGKELVESEQLPETTMLDVSQVITLRDNKVISNEEAVEMLAEQIGDVEINRESATEFREGTGKESSLEWKGVSIPPLWYVKLETKTEGVGKNKKEVIYATLSERGKPDSSIQVTKKQVHWFEDLAKLLREQGKGASRATTNGIDSTL